MREPEEKKQRNVATCLVAGGKLSAFRKTAEIPLMPSFREDKKGFTGRLFRAGCPLRAGASLSL